MPGILQVKSLWSELNQSQLHVCRTLGITLMNVVNLFMENIFEIIHVTVNTVICLNNTNFSCTYIMVVNICETLPKGINKCLNIILIHFRPMSNYKGFKYFHLCKCDKSVKKKTVLFFPLK